tara:strand:+ start:122 stop:223 length:102 start_codon:yes stop_codon:yes gene_type:complete
LLLEVEAAVQTIHLGVLEVVVPVDSELIYQDIL